jgi:nitroreductase
LNTVWKNAREEGYNAGEQDASIVATSMMFEAEDLGIHSIWLRGFNSKLVSEAFELPENIKPVMMLAIGYPSESSTPSPRHSDRKPLADTVEEL